MPDLKIFFVDYPNQAGWRNKAKKHPYKINYS